MNKFKTVMSWVLVVVGCSMVATFGIVRWTEEQFLNTDNWVATMSTLPKDKAVADSVGKQLVSRVFDGSDVTGDIQSVLPPKLVFLAPTITGFLQTKANELASQLIMSDKFSQLWTQANRSAHERLVATLRKPAGDTQAKALPYKINLSKAQDWLEAAASKSDNAALLNASDSVNKVETFNAGLRSGLAQARATVRVSDALYALLPYAILASFLGALALSRRRFKVLMGICIGVIGVNVLAIAGVNFLRPALLNMMQDQTYQPIFSALWNALLPPFLSFARSLVALSFIVIAFAYAWRKGVFGLLVPSSLKKQKFYKLAGGYVTAAHCRIIASRSYIYAVAAGATTLYVAFWPNQTPRSIAQAVFLLLSFVSLVAILGTPKAAQTAR